MFVVYLIMMVWCGMGGRTAVCSGYINMSATTFSRRKLLKKSRACETKSPMNRKLLVTFKYSTILLAGLIRRSCLAICHGRNLVRLKTQQASQKLSLTCNQGTAI